MREFCSSDVGKIANRIMQKEEMARTSENNALSGFQFENPAAFAQGKLVEDLEPPCEVGLAPLAAEDLALLDED